MVIKECKTCLQEFLQNDKLGYYSVTRPFPPLQKGRQHQTIFYALTCNCMRVTHNYLHVHVNCA